MKTCQSSQSTVTQSTQYKVRLGTTSYVIPNLSYRCHRMATWMGCQRWVQQQRQTRCQLLDGPILGCAHEPPRRYVHSNVIITSYLRTPCSAHLARVSLLHVKAHATNAGNNAADRLANNAARTISEVPPSPDWDQKRIDLGRRATAGAAGRPLAGVVSNLDLILAIRELLTTIRLV